MAGLTLDQLSSSFDSRLDNNAENLLLWSASFEAKLEALALVPISGINDFTASITASLTELSSSVSSNSASFNTRINVGNNAVNDLEILTNYNFNVVSNTLVSLNAFSSSITSSLTALSSSVSSTSTSFSSRINTTKNSLDAFANNIGTQVNDINDIIYEEIGSDLGVHLTAYNAFSSSQYKTDSGSFNTRINSTKNNFEQFQLVTNNSFNVVGTTFNAQTLFNEAITASYVNFSGSQYKADSGSFNLRIKNLATSTVPAGTVSSSQQILDYNKFAVTASTNTFYNDQIISGNLYLPTLVPTFNIGDVYQGGEIAYIYQDGDTDYEAGKIKGIIINTTEFNDSGNGQYWGGGSNNTNAQSFTDGVFNTEQIALTSLDLNVNIAALLYEIPTNTLTRKTIDGYDDWFIPSKEEWSNLIYPNYIATSHGTFGSKYYWTSTQSNTSTLEAFVLDVNGYNPGNITTLDKSTQYANGSPMATRIVRKFTVTSTDYMLKYSDTNKSIELGDTIDTFAKLTTNKSNGNQTITGSLILAPQGAPSSPASGSLYFSSVDSHFYGWNGLTWKQLDN